MWKIFSNTLVGKYEKKKAKHWASNDRYGQNAQKMLKISKNRKRKSTMLRLPFYSCQIPERLLAVEVIKSLKWPRSLCQIIHMRQKWSEWPSPHTVRFPNQSLENIRPLCSQRTGIISGEVCAHVSIDPRRVDMHRLLIFCFLHISGLISYSRSGAAFDS